MRDVDLVFGIVEFVVDRGRESYVVFVVGEVGGGVVVRGEVDIYVYGRGIGVVVLEGEVIISIFVDWVIKISFGVV